jgi:hypothetical protein
MPPSEHSPFGPDGHVLDVTLVELADTHVQVGGVNEHLAGCLLCRSRLRSVRSRLHIDFEVDAVTAALPDVPAVPAAVHNAVTRLESGWEPNPGEVWLTAGSVPATVWVRKLIGSSALVQPVTFDVEFADSHTAIFSPEENPLGVPLAVVCSIDAQVDLASLAGRLCTLDVGDTVDALRAARRSGSTPPPNVTVGPPIEDSQDERLEYRQELSDRLAALAAPDDSLDQAEVVAIRDRLEDLRSRRASGACHVRACDEETVAGAADGGWVAVAVIQELDVTIIVAIGTLDADIRHQGRVLLDAADATALALVDLGAEYDTRVYSAEHLAAERRVAPSGEDADAHAGVITLELVDALFKYLDDANLLDDETNDGDIGDPDASEALDEIVSEESERAIETAHGRRFQRLKGKAFKNLHEDDAGVIAQAVLAASEDGTIVERVLGHSRKR